MPLLMAMQELVRNDQLLSDIETRLFSSRQEMQDTPANPTGFMLYSDRFEKTYPTFTLGENLRLIPGPDTPVVNFGWLKDLLLSTDLTRISELEWAAKEMRFLDGKVDLADNRIAFVSYPRTGNTMTRTCLEAVTGIYTGSNMDLLITSAF